MFLFPGTSGIRLEESQTARGRNARWRDTCLAELTAERLDDIHCLVVIRRAAGAGNVSGAESEKGRR